jgi:hypothetical protein
VEPIVEWDVVVVGGINTDYLIRGQALPGPGMSLGGDMFLERARRPAPPRPLPDDLLIRVDVIRAHATEVEALTGVCIRDHASAREGARARLARGAKAAIVEAERGNLVVPRGVSMRQAPAMRLPRCSYAANDREGHRSDPGPSHRTRDSGTIRPGRA